MNTPPEPITRGASDQLLNGLYNPAEESFRIVMLNGEALVMTYTWLLTMLVSRAYPKALPQWAYWSYAQLEMPGAARRAAQDADLADWLVFCQATSAVLPRAVQRWAERWLGAKRRSKVKLGVLALSDGISKADGVETYLRGLASRTGMEFLDVGDWLYWMRRDYAQKRGAWSRAALPCDWPHNYSGPDSTMPYF